MRDLFGRVHIAEIPPTTVGKKGLLTLIEFRKRRSYRQLEQYLKKLEKKEVLVRKKCRSDFTDTKRSLQCSDVTTSKPKKLNPVWSHFHGKRVAFYVPKKQSEMTNIPIESRFSM